MNDGCGGTSAISDEDCMEGLKILRRRAQKKYERARDEGWKSSQIEQFELEVNSVDMAISLVSGRRGLREDRKESIGFDYDELTELVRLIDDEEDLDETLLSQLRKRMDRARRRIERLPIG